MTDGRRPRLWPMKKDEAERRCDDTPNAGNPRPLPQRAQTAHPRNAGTATGPGGTEPPRRTHPRPAAPPPDTAPQTRRRTHPGGTSPRHGAPNPPAHPPRRPTARPARKPANPTGRRPPAPAMADEKRRGWRRRPDTTTPGNPRPATRRAQTTTPAERLHDDKPRPCRTDTAHTTPAPTRTPPTHAKPATSAAAPPDNDPAGPNHRPRQTGGPGNSRTTAVPVFRSGVTPGRRTGVSVCSRPPPTG